MTAKLECIFEATYDWLNIAYPINDHDHGGIDWEAAPLRWNEIQELARQEGLDPEDEEICASILIEPRDCDTALRAGDIVLTTGYEGDVYFFRKANS